jgi:hypothetical protein
VSSGRAVHGDRVHGAVFAVMSSLSRLQARLPSASSNQTSNMAMEMTRNDNALPMNMGSWPAGPAQEAIGFARFLSCVGNANP